MVAVGGVAEVGASVVWTACGAAGVTSVRVVLSVRAGLDVMGSSILAWACCDDDGGGVVAMPSGSVLEVGGSDLVSGYSASMSAGCVVEGALGGLGAGVAAGGAGAACGVGAFLAVGMGGAVVLAGSVAGAG